MEWRRASARTTGDPHVAVIPEVVDHHCREATFLWALRQQAKSRAGIHLGNLMDLDERLQAHLDGVVIAAESGWLASKALLADIRSDALFLATFVALASADADRLSIVYAIADANPAALSGFASALGWVPPKRLRGVSKALLLARSPCLRAAGVASCALHRVDVGPSIHEFIEDEAPVVRVRALKFIGELGRLDMKQRLDASGSSADSAIRLAAAWSAVLLGDRNRAVSVLLQMTPPFSPYELRAFYLALQALPVHAGHDVLRDLASNALYLRLVIHGCGVVGDPAYVPWLVKQMADRKLARIAGEAISVITGVDLAGMGLDKTPAGHLEPPANEDPDDADVVVDPDDGLVWPDQQLVEAWWALNSGRFRPGLRYFMGETVTREHCLKVLKTGYQRQRILAAHHLCLLEPGTPLFNTSAPAWRQQRLLAQMS